MDENLRYMYGIVEKKEFSKEIGVWLKQELENIGFEVKMKDGDSSFTSFYGKLFPDRIEFSIPFYFKDQKTKEFLIQHFANYGLQITNLE